MSEDTVQCPYCRNKIRAGSTRCKHCGEGLHPSQTLPAQPAPKGPTVGSPVLSGRYRIIKELGRGGMAIVYLAHDDELNMPVAVKLLPAEMSRDKRSLEQLAAEARVSMSLAHPNIVRLHNLDTSGKTKFLVMEYVDGPTLKQVLRKRGRLKFEEALPMLRAVCQGLHYAHSQRVLHRDLKPANIMLSSKREVKIADFGIARQMQESMREFSQKTVSGTPSYMAPEHLMGEHITVRTDIYSLGSVTYELFTGHPPFHRGDVLAQVRFKDPDPMINVPNPVNDVVLAALAKEPQKRPANAALFYQALTAAILRTPAKRAPKRQAPPPPSPPPRPAPARKTPPPIVEKRSEPAEPPVIKKTPPKPRKARPKKTDDRKHPRQQVDVPAWLTPALPGTGSGPAPGPGLPPKEAMRADRRGERRTLAIIVLVLGLIIAGLIYYAQREMAARSRFKTLSAQVETFLLSVGDEPLGPNSEKKLRDLHVEARDFRDSNWFSILVLSGREVDLVVDKLAGRVKRIEEGRRAQVELDTRRNEDMYREAGRIYQTGDYMRALALYRKVRTELLGEDLANLVKGRITEISGYFSAARQLYDAAIEDVKAQRWAAAEEKLGRLFVEYPRFIRTAEVPLPVLIRTIPEGAKVEAGGSVVGTTPCVVYRLPGRRADITVSLRGYEPMPPVVPDDSMWSIDFRLRRGPQWVFDAGSAVEASPAADADRVYFGTGGGVVFALSLENGKKEWEFKSQGVFGAFAGSPSLARGKLYIGSYDKKFYALNAETGKMLWDLKIGAIVRSTPSGVGVTGLVCVGDMGGVLHGISTRTETRAWTFIAGDEISSRPAIRNNLVYFGADDGQVYALDARSGMMVWSFATRGAVRGGPVFHRDAGSRKELLIVGSADGTVYALDLSVKLGPGQNREMWSFRTGGEVATTACVEGDSVYVTSSDGRLYCLSVATGARKWSFITGAKALSGPAVSGGVVYFGGSDSHFYAVSAETGKLLWKYEVSGEILGSPVALGDRVLVGTNSGRVYCFVKPR